MTHARGFWEVKQPEVGEVDDRWVIPGPALQTFIPKPNAVKQKAVISVLAQGEVRMAELTAEYGGLSAVIRALEAKDVLRVEHRRRLRTEKLPRGDARFVVAKRPVLTAGQQAAVQAIRERRARGGGCVLVDGVTGSGKTEVYLCAIEEVLAEGKTACVLVPEISLTPQTVARFRGRFGDVVAVLHSRMTDGERYDQWDNIRNGEARVVVGARSALFAPLENLGLIVIDEEHEYSYKQDQAPRYVSRDVARWMADQRPGCVVVLGSATPSLEALELCRTRDDCVQVKLESRANGRELPPITIVDRAKEFHSGKRSAVFSPLLARSMESELDAGHKCVLMLNQRGFARFLLCRDCGFIPTCENCSTSYTFHQRGPGGPHLTCHHCGTTIAPPARCPQCGSPYLRLFGAGTQRVEEELRAFLSGCEGAARETRVIRMDADTTSTRGAHQRLLEEFAKPGAAVLLGTQMIAKGLDFDDVTLVGVISADTMLAIPDFRSAERTFDLIEQVAGRAGRASLPGRVIVQTYQADDPAILAAAHYDRDTFLRDELPKRRILGYPPFTRLSNVLIWGEDEALVTAEARRLHKQLEVSLQTLGPSADTAAQAGAWSLGAACPCALERLNKRFRWHILIKTSPDADVSGVLSGVMKSWKAPSGVTISVDIDAIDLL